MKLFVNRLKKGPIISELKAREAEMLRQMQMSPQEFDPSKLKISTECPEPTTTRIFIQNLQPITASRTNRVPEAIQTTQEKFQIT